MSSLRYDFSGSTAFVTGATGGMGKAIVDAFVATGANVFATDVAGIDGAASIGPGRAVFRQLDVSDGAAVAEAVEACVAEFGSLDHAINAAAIENESGPLHETTVDAFARMIAVNVNGIFFCMKHQIDAMLTGGKGGTIVNIASTNSFRPQPNQPAYTAAKHAVLGLTKSAAIDYAGKGIRINAIAPGSIDTPMLRNAMERRGRDPHEVASRLSLIGRFGTPDEIAQATLWLSSEGSSFTMGHTVAVDAGYLAR